MVSAPSSSVSAGCLLRHHPEACTDPSTQRVLLSLQKRVVGVLKERLHSVTHFSSLKGWPPFTWAALCLAPRWGGGEPGKILPLPLCPSILFTARAPGLLFLMHLLFLRGGRWRRRKPVHEANASSVQRGEFLISTSAFLRRPRAGTEMGPCGPHCGGTHLGGPALAFK